MKAAVVACALAALGLGLTAPQARAQPPKQFEFKVQEVGVHLNGTVGRAEGLPLNRRYAELDPAEQALVRARYENMPAADEPPYPAEGLLPLFQTVQTGPRPPALGQLTLVADVDGQGRVRHVDTFGQVDAGFARYVAQVLSATPFKPGRCAGAPCNMQYVLKMQIAAR